MVLAWTYIKLKGLQRRFNFVIIKDAHDLSRIVNIKGKNEKGGRTKVLGYLRVRACGKTPLLPNKSGKTLLWWRLAEILAVC